MKKWISKAFQGFKVVAEVSGFTKFNFGVKVFNRLFNKNKESEMKKFISRKFFMTFWPAMAMILGSYMNPEAVEATKEVFLGVVALIMSYNGARAHVDGKNK